MTAKSNKETENRSAFTLLLQGAPPRTQLPPQRYEQWSVTDVILQEMQLTWHPGIVDIQQPNPAYSTQPL